MIVITAHLFSRGRNGAIRGRDEETLTGMVSVDFLVWAKRVAAVVATAAISPINPPAEGLEVRHSAGLRMHALTKSRLDSSRRSFPSR